MGEKSASGGRRIVVVGSTGSGKTTLAGALARRLGVPHVELDALHWGPDWTEVPDSLFRERVAEAVSGDAWVVDGNYSQARDIVWGRAVTVVWLDYDLHLIWWQLLKRTLWRVAIREELWHGNRESLRTAFLSKDSLFVWALQTYGKRKREYSMLSASPEYSHLRWVRLRSPGQTRRWLARLPVRDQRI